MSILDILNATECNARLETLRPLTLGNLPLNLKAEINLIGAANRGSAEHIAMAMFTLLAYAFGAGATVVAHGKDGNDLRARCNLLVVIAQPSGGGKSPVAQYVAAVLRRLGVKIRAVLHHEALAREARLKEEPCKNIFVQ